MFWNRSANKKIKEYQARLAQNAGDAEAHFLLGVEYERRGDRLKALSAFEEVLRLNPRSAEAHFNLALLCESLNQGRRAIQHIVQAGNLFSAQNKTEQKNRARQLLREFHARFPQNPDAPPGHEPDR